jgi:hypothetical protein
MLIAEALTNIKDLEKQRREVQSKIRDGIYILPDLKAEEKPETVETQMAELEKVTEEIATLKIRIIQTNVNTSISVPAAGGMLKMCSLMAAIKEIESCRYFETQLTEIANHMDNKNVRYFSPGDVYMSQGEPITLLPNFTTSSKALRQKAKEYHAQARAIEQALVKANWQTEIV